MRGQHSKQHLIVSLRRLGAVVMAALISAGATRLFIQFAGQDGFTSIDILRAGLIAISTAWLAWGAVLSLFGLFHIPEDIARLPERTPLTGRTIILVPVCNEDPVVTFSRVAAMHERLTQLGMSENFDFAILSDTSEDQIATREAQWFARLVRERHAEGRMFYRRRTDNAGKKSGNIEDFIRHSGAAYPYALILDADSLMDGTTIVEMARRLEADPGLGLLQSLPVIIGARSFFSRTTQFSASYYSPVFARGLAMLQGEEGPFWGHNAILRTRAFAESCGLPPLSGHPPFGGHILSHDYVEAALLARAGWRVRLDPDLEASYEEGPQNIIEFVKRDRRWCQGNLQHLRLLLTPGLHPWSRFTFAQGIMAYLASPIWLSFLIASIIAPFAAPPPNYFPEAHFPFPVFPANDTFMAVMLILSITCLLVLPKLLIFVRGMVIGEHAKFGGSLRVLTSTFIEIIFSSLTAPLMLWFQSRAVLQVLAGVDGGWPVANRAGEKISFAQGWEQSKGIVVTGVTMFVFSAWVAPAMMIWLIPIAGPMALAPWLISASSSQTGRARTPYLFATPNELASVPVIQCQKRTFADWSGATAPTGMLTSHIDRAIPVKG